MNWISPGRITPPPPVESWCRSAPDSTYDRISMSRWPCRPKPPPGATRSSFSTRSARKPMCDGSWYSPNENVWRLSSQPQSVRPRSCAFRVCSIPRFWLVRAVARLLGSARRRSRRRPMGSSEFEEAYEDDEQPRESEERRLGEAILNASIRDLDPRPALTLPDSAPLGEAVRMMRDERIGAVLVTRDQRPVGIFTERDILRRVVLTGLPAETPLRDVMTSEPETLGIDDNVGFALNRMILGGFRHIPVTDDDGHAVGVLSQREIVAFVVSLLPNRILNLPPEPKLQARSEDGG